MSDRQIDYPEGSREKEVAVSRAMAVCRVCQQPVKIDPALPGDWWLSYYEVLMFGRVKLRLKHGREFAHAACVDARV